MDRRGPLLEPGLDLSDGRQGPEPRLVDLLEQVTTAGDQRGGEARPLDRGGAVVAARGPSIPRRAPRSSWPRRPRSPSPAAGRRDSRLPGEVGRRHADRAGDDRREPFPCWPVKLLPVAAMTGMFIAASCPIRLVTCSAAPPSSANQFWA